MSPDMRYRGKPQGAENHPFSAGAGPHSAHSSAFIIGRAYYLLSGISAFIYWEESPYKAKSAPMQVCEPRRVRFHLLLTSRRPCPGRRYHAIECPHPCVHSAHPVKPGTEEGRQSLPHLHVRSGGHSAHELRSSTPHRSMTPRAQPSPLTIRCRPPRSGHDARSRSPSMQGRETPTRRSGRRPERPQRRSPTFATTARSMRSAS